MPKLSNISVDQYVTMNALKHSSLYGGRSFESAKLGVLDHLLSTVGNGITFNDLVRDSKNNYRNKKILAQDATHLFDGTPMYYISKIVPKSDGNYAAKEYLINPKTGEEVFTLPMAQIKEFGWDNPEEYEWFENSHRKIEEWRPYPDFAKDYSIVWNHKNELSKLPVDFLKAFIEYYKITLDFFTTEKQYLYHYACPRPDDEKMWKLKLKEWQDIYEKYTKDIENDEEKMKHFSKGYGATYSGNMREFLENRHKKNIEKCISFIKETLIMLEEKVS